MVRARRRPRCIALGLLLAVHRLDAGPIAYSDGHLLWAIRGRDGAEVYRPTRQLTHDPRVEDRHPSWSPDGGHVFFSRELANGSNRPPHLIVLDVATGEERDIGEGQEPDWGQCAA